MGKFMNFDLNVRNAFDNNEETYMSFNKLMMDAAHGSLDGVTPKQANDKIVEMFRSVIGVDEHATKAEVRKAIRRNQTAVFEIIEEVIDDMLVSGWQQNPFFREYVDVRNLAMGAKDAFYVPDNSALSVMKVSGIHHDIFLMISVRTK